jgi:L-ascorbate metabolism protein UlaG (beta-lactamase superfamily)
MSLGSRENLHTSFSFKVIMKTMNNTGMMLSIVAVGIVAVIAVIFWLVASPDTIPQVQLNNTATTSTSTENEAISNSPVVVTPIEHASAVLMWNAVSIYTDPVGDAELYAAMPDPDLILLTDIHADHLSTSTLSALMASGTDVVAPQAVADLLPASVLERTTVLANGATTTKQGFLIEAIPMYNLPETDDSRHVKGRGNGYVLERGDERVYIAGDTAGTPEMRALQDIDIAFIPMNEPFTMNVEDAAQAVLAFAPAMVYPYHYRGQNGLSDVEQFRDLVNAGDPGIEVVLLNWYPSSE